MELSVWWNSSSLLLSSLSSMMRLKLPRGCTWTQSVTGLQVLQFCNCYSFHEVMPRNVLTLYGLNLQPHMLAAAVSSMAA